MLKRTSERWHPLPGAPRRNRVECLSKEGHFNSQRGSGLSSRVLLGAYLVDRGRIDMLRIIVEILRYVRRVRAAFA